VSRYPIVNHVMPGTALAMSRLSRDSRFILMVPARLWFCGRRLDDNAFTSLPAGIFNSLTNLIDVYVELPDPPLQLHTCCLVC